MPVPSTPQDLITLIREKLYDNTSGIIEEDTLRNVLENIINILDAKFSFFSPTLTEEQYAQWNLMLDYMLRETKGVLTISSTAPTGPTAKGKYLLSDVGTYTNLGGIVTTTGKLNYAYFDGTTWSLIAVTMPKGADGSDGKTIEEWSAKAYVAGSSVYYDNKIYNTTTATLATDVPSFSSLWVEQLLNTNKDIAQHTELNMISYGFTVTTPIVNYWGTNETVQYGNLPDINSRFQKTDLVANQIFKDNLTFYLIAEIYCDTAQTQLFQIYNYSTSSYLFNITKNLQAGLNTIIIPFKPTTANINTNILNLYIGFKVGAFYLRNVRFVNSTFLPDITYSKTLKQLDDLILSNTTVVNTIENSFSWNKFCVAIKDYTTTTNNNFGNTNLVNNNIKLNKKYKIYIKAQYIGRFTLYAQRADYSTIVILNIPNDDFTSGKTYDFTIPSGEFVNLTYHSWVTGTLFNEISILKYEILPENLPANLPLTGLKWASLGDSVTDDKKWQKKVEELTGITPYVRACGSSALSFSIGQMAVMPDGTFISRRYTFSDDASFIADVNSKGFTNQITSVSWTDYSANPSAYPTIGSDATAYFLIETKGNSTDRVNTIPLDTDIVSIMFFNDFITSWDDTTIGTIYDFTINTSINSGNGSFIANLRQLIDKIKTRLPKAKIILMIPYQRQYTHYDLATNQLMSEGISTEKMRDAIRSVARTYGFYTIDLTKVINYNNYSFLLSDIIHPNEKGSKQLGYFIADDFLSKENWLKNKIV